MNRLELPPLMLSSGAESSGAEALASDAVRPICKAVERAVPSFPHSVFSPLHYERGYAYPLIVWLHSEEADQSQLRTVMPQISLRNYIGAAPRACESSESVVWNQQPDSVEQAGEDVHELVQYVDQRLNISPERVFLAGYGRGGTMALRLAFNNPQAYAGVISIAGRLPQGDRPLRNVNQLRDLSVLMMTGRNGVLYSPNSICADLRVMHAAGITVSYRQYADETLGRQQLSDLDHWLMESITC